MGEAVLVCVGCGVEPVEGRTKYCSATCRERLKKQRQRARQRELMEGGRAPVEAPKLAAEKSAVRLAVRQEADLAARLEGYRVANDELYGVSMEVLQRKNRAEHDAMQLVLMAQRMMSNPRGFRATDCEKALFDKYMHLASEQGLI